MARGLDDRQKRARDQSKTKIFEYISKNEPCTQAMIVKDSGVKDPKVVRKILLELEKNDNTIASKIFHFSVSNQKGRKFYFITPFSEKIQSVMGREDSRKIMGAKYYLGIKKDIPLERQYAHKLTFLNEEFNELKKSFEKRAKNYELIAGITNYENLILNNLEFFVYVIKTYYSVINDPDNAQMYYTYFNAVFKSIIEKMDLWHSNFKELRNNSKVAGPIKTIIASMMIEQSKSGVMKKVRMSPKSGTKLEKEMLNKDGSPKIEVINEINKKSIGEKEFEGVIPSGETLMKKWKKIQQDV